MTRIGRLMGLLIAVGGLQNGVVVAQSAEIGHNPLAATEVGTNGRVSAAVVFDDGNGPALYIGGEFTSVNGMPANRVAKWDGQSWSAVGAGINLDRHLEFLWFADLKVGATPNETREGGS